MADLNLDTPRWMKPLLKPLRYKGAKGGRGSGKSWGFAEMMIEAHLDDPDTSSVCIREVQKTLHDSVKKLLERTIHRMGVGSYFDVQESVIKSRHGKGRIIFLGMQNHTAESIKSLEGYDRAWVEEAQSLSQRSLDLLRPTIRAEGSELWFTWNPVKPEDPIDKLLCGDTPPDSSAVVDVNFVDNPWFTDVLRKEMEHDKATADPGKFAHVWYGAYWTRSEALVFTNWKVQEFEAPADAEHRFGADWGFAVDPTTLVRCHIIGRRLYVDFEAYQIGCPTRDLSALFATVPDSDLWPIVADSARPENIDEVKKHGFPKTIPSIKGAESVEQGVDWLQGFEIVVHPRCVHTIRELGSYSYKIDKDRDVVLPQLADKNNHVMDALRYACESARRTQKAKRAPPKLLPSESRW